MWKELLAYTVTFLLISMVYRKALSESHMKQMEDIILWCREQSSGEQQ